MNTVPKIMLDNYQIDEFGVIHQIIWKPKVYDKQYLSYYEGLQSRTIKLGYQRMGWTLGLLRKLPALVLEIGSGPAHSWKRHKLPVSRFVLVMTLPVIHCPQNAFL